MISFSSVLAAASVVQRSRAALPSLLLLAAPFVLACTDSETVQAADSSVASAEAPAAPVTMPGARAAATPSTLPSVPVATEATAASVSKADFRTMRWIQGSWVGGKGSKLPFYQTFEAANDTTILVTTFADENFSAASESGTFLLTGTHAYYGPETASWIVSKWSGNHIEFSPYKGVSTGFTWDKVSDDQIRVTRTWSEGGAQQQQVITMLRRSK